MTDGHSLVNEETRSPLLIQAEAAHELAMRSLDEGRHAADRIAAEARRTGDEEALVVALRASAWASRELFDHERAGADLAEAWKVARRSGNVARLTEVLITQSALHLEMGRIDRARRDLMEARSSAPPHLLSEVAFAEAVIHQKAGDFAAASSAYGRAVDAAPDGRPDVVIRALNNRALADVRLARYSQAEQHLADAADLAESFSAAFAAIIAHNGANIAMAAGRPVDALRRYDRAETMLSSAGLPLVEHYVDKAHALFGLRLLREAADAVGRALQELDGPGGALMRGEMLLLRADIARAEQDLDAAAIDARDAADLFRRQRRSGWYATAALLHTQVEWQQGSATQVMADRLARIEHTMQRAGNVPAFTEAALLHGQVATALGRRRRARTAFQRAATAARGPVMLKLRGRLATAFTAELDGNTRRLSHVCRAGLDELGTYRSVFGSAELRVRAAAHGATLAQLGLRAAVRTGRGESIWAWIERGRAIVTVREGTVGGDDELTAEVAQLRALEGDLLELSPDATTAQADLLRQVTQLENRIRGRTWTTQARTATSVTPSVSSLRALRSGLTTSVLLQYGALDGKLLGVVVTSELVRVVELGVLDEIVAAGRQLAFALRRLARPRSRAGVDAAFASAHHELEALGTTLVAPFADVVGGVEEAVVVPNAELIGVPWGALPDLEHCAVQVTPTASLWAMTRHRAARSDDVVLVAGPDLRAADAEVSEIAAAYRTPTILTGDQATVDAVRSAAMGARTVHLACHGKLRRDAAVFSSLRLSDGPLTVHDLEQLPTSAHHWILAACDLGSPGELVGPELDGVVATLLLRGAAGVVAAVVSVPDLETRGMMKDLHGALASGASLAHAVRAARQGVDSSDPAGFVASVAFSCYGGG